MSLIFDFDILQGQEDLFLPHNVQTGSSVYPASYPAGIGVLLQGGKAVRA
jgi:hypothetical protein